jgi:hypothetical protein
VSRAEVTPTGDHDRLRQRRFDDSKMAAGGGDVPRVLRRRLPNRDFFKLW